MARTHFLKILGVNTLVFVALLALAEGVAQVTMFVRPAYDVLSLCPDRAVGWTEVPDLSWRWGGPRWYASDYTVDVEANSLGFRDTDHDETRPEGVKRVALLGDSFVEAVQVPFGDTGAQLLERSLNEGAAGSRWEVLNFGISNYGVGQYLLVWEHFARRFQPDYVAIFVARFHMERTLRRYEFGTFPGTKERALWVRPTFRLEGDSLVREPARDYDEFVRVQEDLVGDAFGGRRSRRRMPLVTAYYARELARRIAVRFHPPPARPPERVAEAEMLEVNERVIEELGSGAAAAGARLVVVDASRYFGDDASVSRALEALCAEHGFGYIPLYEDLLDANRAGVSTRWPHDYHFNRAGNAILADALADWIASAESASPRR
jgi:lysophospholipase L1-like esterase